MWLLAVNESTVDRLQLSPGLQTLLAASLIAYLVVLAILSLVASRQVETEEDYLVAGRKLSLFLCCGSIVAAWFGAAAMTATSEAARESGLLGVILDPFACSATLIYTGVMFAAPMWRMKLLTISDFYRRTYGAKAELMGAGIQVLAFFGWIALQYKALAGVQAVYFEIPLEWGVLIACGLTLAYTMVGGMWSVTVTDTLQVMVAFTGLLVLAYTTYVQFGGGSVLAGADRLLTETDPALLTLIPPATAAAVLAYGSSWATGVFGCVPGQDLQQRLYAARTPQTAQRACILAGMIYFGFTMIPVSLGLISRLVESEAEGDIVQVLASKYFTPGLAVVFVLSFTSVVLSTSTSAVLAPATILSHNILGRLPVFRGHALFRDRLCVLLIAMGGLALAFSRESKMELLDLVLSMQLVALYVPLHMGLYGRPRSEWSAILPMLVGMGCYLARWLPEKLLCPAPEAFSGEYADFAASQFNSPAWQGIMRCILTVPDSIFGLVGSFLAYGVAQALFRRSAPINDQTLNDAWGDAWKKKPG
ncbi:MAG: sodium:solute symporter [Planctomycetaceae bacterium]|nr:sodium:solute symporter [Planctomycetaceae bacterium]